MFLSEDIYDLHPDHESKFEEGEELFVSAKQVNEFLKDGAMMFIVLSLLEAKRKGVISELPIICEFP